MSISLLSLIAIVFLFLFFFVAKKSIFYGILLISATMPSYLVRLHIGTVPTTWLELQIIILFFLWIFEKKITPKEFLRFFLSLEIWPIFLLLFFASSISVLSSPDVPAALGIWKAYFLEPMIFLLILIHTVRFKQIRHFMWPFCFTVFFISVIACYQKLTAWNIPLPEWRVEATRRVTFFFDSPNAVGLLLAPMVAFIFAIFASEIRTNQSKPISNPWQSFYQLLMLASMVMGALAIWFARSRAALIAVGISALFIVYHVWPKKIVFSLLALMLGIIVVITPIRSAFLDLATFQVASGRHRLMLYENTWNMLKDNVFYGAGLAGFPFFYDQYRSPKHTEKLIYPHNFFLNFWSETGLLGMLSITALLMYFFFISFQEIRKKNPVAIALTSSMMAILIHGMVDVPYFKNDLAILFWLIYGLAYIVWKNDHATMSESATLPPPLVTLSLPKGVEGSFFQTNAHPCHRNILR